jgi:hypothetical protein
MHWRKIINVLSILVAVTVLAVGMLAVGTAQCAAASDLRTAKGILALNRESATIHFDSPHKLGDLTLQVGSYRFQHRTVAGEHLTYFTRVGGRTL